MIGVFDVLHVELPVARQDLAVAAEHPDRRTHHAADRLDEFCAEILIERRRICRQRAEHETSKRVYPQLARRMRLRFGIRRHAALAAETASERDAGEVAL